MGLGALDRAGQARSAQRARLAERFGLLKLGRQIREPQLRILGPARQRPDQLRRSSRQNDKGGAGHNASNAFQMGRAPGGAGISLAQTVAWALPGCGNPGAAHIRQLADVVPACVTPVV
jgi:hypothetical protein